MEDAIPTLTEYRIPLPYVLAQISSGMRRIELTTPIVWARMEVPFYYRREIMGKQDYLILAES